MSLSSSHALHPELQGNFCVAWQALSSINSFARPPRTQDLHKWDTENWQHRSWAKYKCMDGLFKIIQDTNDSYNKVL